MWEYTTDPTINLWGLVNKNLDEEFIVDSGKGTPNTGPPPSRKQKHL
jgi:hypothetical protein